MYGLKPHCADPQASRGREERRFYQFDSDGTERDEHAVDKHESGDCRENRSASEASANPAFCMVIQAIG